MRSSSSPQSALTMRFFALLGIVQVIGIGSIVFGALLPVYVGAMAVLGVLLFSDFPRIPEERPFTGQISVPPKVELGSSFPFELTVKSQSSGHLSRLEAIVPPSRLIYWTSERIALTGSPPKGAVKGTADSLGSLSFKSITLLCSSPLGFWFRTASAEIDPVELRIVPSMRAVPAPLFTEIAMSQRLLQQGSRLLIRNRTADQFYTVRRYQYPDSIRHIDQKKTAKFGQLMTRVYDSFQSHHLVLALDLGRAMCGDLARSRKVDFYLSACLHLAQQALRAQDRVSFYAFSDEIHLSIPHARRMESLAPLVRGDPALKAREEATNFRLLNEAVAVQAGQRSIVLILSDLSYPSVQESILSTVPSLSRKHLVALVGLIDRNYDLTSAIAKLADSALTEDEYARLLYTYWLTEQFKSFSAKVSSLGGAAIRVSEEFWMSAVEQVYLRLRISTSL